MRLTHRTIILIVIVASVGIACNTSSKGPYSAGAGTIPSSNDKDGDGVPDDWETNGVDYTYPPDGSKHHLDLKSEGASPEHKDIFIWVAWMEDATHSHKPEPEAIAIVKQAFANAPVKNIDNYPGINVHVVLAPEAIPEKQMIGSVDVAGNYDWTEYDTLKSKYFPKELEGVFHFCLFAHDIDAEQNSGITKNIPGRDFIVSLGGFTNMVGTVQEKAGTLIHELGHALGLRHGGVDDTNYKPNYISIMNYSFQLNGIPINGVQGNYDYSRFQLDCSETRMDKTKLTSDATLAKYGTFYYCCATCKNPSSLVPVQSIAATTPVDWNCDGTIQPRIVATDINNDQQITDLAGLDDWQHIILKPSVAALGVAPQSVSGVKVSREITPKEADTIRLFPVGDVAAVKAGANVFVRWNQVPLDRVLAYRVYRTTGSNTRPQLAGTVDATTHPNFTDTGAKEGTYQYFVTAVFAPHSFAVQKGTASFPLPVKNAEIPLNPVKPLGRSPASSDIHFSLAVREILNPAQLADIRETSSTKSAHFENLGQNAPQNRASFGDFPKTLYETDLSAPASIVVK